MSNENGGFILGILIFAYYIGTIIGTGMLAWNICPIQGFFSFLGFMILWSVFETIAHIIGYAILKAITD